MGKDEQEDNLHHQDVGSDGIRNVQNTFVNVTDDGAEIDDVIEPLPGKSSDTSD